MVNNTLTENQIEALGAQIVCEYERAKSAFNIVGLKKGRCDETCFTSIIKNFLRGVVFYPEAHKINYPDVFLPKTK